MDYYYIIILLYYYEWGGGTAVKQEVPISFSLHAKLYPFDVGGYLADFSFILIIVIVKYCTALKADKLLLLVPGADPGYLREGAQLFFCFAP